MWSIKGFKSSVLNGICAGYQIHSPSDTEVPFYMVECSLVSLYLNIYGKGELSTQKEIFVSTQIP